ncbi:MAG TPA: aminotransferase class I/II-fold pyridoxal phosphate-dependent enzyme, partial [Actinomycetes bacterium]|nr:aminotransferase class I/II-fold pyridoxal phosphate-dependent enzyme [Actinomycetes bacterium]
LILEDDYDAEFRYDRRPVGTMHGTDPSRVVLLGSLSKTLSPALGIGWMVTPPAWTEPVRATTGTLTWPATLDQLTFAAFLEAGAYDRHLRAARKRYRLRRDRLVRALGEHLPGARVLGVAAGLHLLVLLDGTVDCAVVVNRAAAGGTRVANLDTYRVRDDAIGPGLVLGYGNLADGQVEEAVALLATAVAEARGAVTSTGPDRR